MKKKIIVIIAIPLVLVFAYWLTYIPQSVVNIEPSNVSKMTIFNGNSGHELIITDQSDIDYIVNNLNDVTFQKGKLSFGYMGFSFRTTIYNHKGKAVKKLIINSEDIIRYKGFFYTAKNNSVDYDYISQLFVTEGKSNV